MNIAVVGVGYWGKKVTREYLELTRRNPKAQFSRVCDLRDENLKYCSEVLHIPKDDLSKDWKSIIDSNEVDAVHICTPNETHHEICKEALKANKHVLLEKPMALHAREAWELVGLAKSRNLILQVGHIFRFNNALRMLRDLISQHYLGEVYYLKLQWTTLMPSPFNRDIIFDLGPHPVDILNYLLNRWPDKVLCRARAYRRKLLEELAFITLEFDGKLIANIELSWLQPGKVREVTVIGSERTATVDCLKQSVRICESEGKRLDLEVTGNNTLQDEICHFVESIHADKNSRNEGAVGARNVAVLESLRRSREEERTMKMDWPW